VLRAIPRRCQSFLFSVTSVTSVANNRLSRRAGRQSCDSNASSSVTGSPQVVPVHT
jgi:hypothetical protein